MTPTNTTTGSGQSAPATLPREIRWFFAFQFCNAINFTIALGAPMVVIARYLGAGESLLGFIFSFTPFLIFLQLLASNTAERIGYKRLMLAGWGARAFLIFLAAPLPLLIGHVPPLVILATYTLLLFGFNLIRGYTCLAWLPWVSQIVPVSQRGRYFGLEQTTVNAGVLVTLLFCGWFLGGNAEAWKCTLLLLVSWLAGWSSVTFLNRVPCTMPPGSAERSVRTRDQLLNAYRYVWADTRFRHITLFAALNSFAIAAFPGFLLVFQKDHLHLSDGMLLVLAGASTLGAGLTGVFLGRFTDKFGSRPTLRLAGIGQSLLLAVWALVAIGVLQPGRYEIAGLYLLFGIIQCATAVPHVRLILAFCPTRETTIGVTLNAVLVSVCGGLAPLLWGVTLAGLKHGATDGTFPQPYTIFFGVCCALSLAAQLALTRVREPAATPTVQVMMTLFRDWPLRVISDIGWFGEHHNDEKKV